MFNRVTRSLNIVMFLFLPFIIQAAVDINDPFFQKLEKAFLCIDGCGMALEDCSNRTAEQMRSDLQDFIRQGLSEIEIKNYMVEIYGVEVLREPPKYGFNLIVWTAPFLALLAGFVMIFMAVNKWVFYKRLNRTDDAVDETDNEDVEIYSSLIDEERKKYF